MAPSFRSRYREQGKLDGLITTYLDGQQIGESSWIAHRVRQRTEDVVGNPTGMNTFWSDKYETDGSIVNFEQKGSYARVVKNCGSTAYGSWTHLTGGRTISDDEIITRLKASGPLTPRVNLPLFLFELKDVPMMIRHAGDLLHKIRRPSLLDPVAEAAAANIALKFGWEPLIEDLRRMVLFGKLVRDRQDNLRRAATEKGYRSKIKFDSDHLTYPQFPYSMWTTGYWIDATISTDTQLETWATMRWRLKPGQNFGKDPSYVDAFRAVYGLNAGHIPIAIWKGLPWTWAMDWFVDMSSALQASYNMLYYTPFNACRMDRTTTTWTHPEVRDSENNVILTALTKKRITKTRKPLSIPTSNLPHLKLPFLDDFKLSILGSLGVLRLKSAAR